MAKDIKAGKLAALAVSPARRRARLKKKRGQEEYHTNLEWRRKGTVPWSECGHLIVEHHILMDDKVHKTAGVSEEKNGEMMGVSCEDDSEL